MMKRGMIYTLQVSNHPQAGDRLPTAEAGLSWQTIYDGQITTSSDARQAVERLARLYRHARAFRGGGTRGKLWYAVLDMRHEGK